MRWPHCWQLSAGNESWTPQFSHFSTTTTSTFAAEHQAQRPAHAGTALNHEKVQSRGQSAEATCSSATSCPSLAPRCTPSRRLKDSATYLVSLLFKVVLGKPFRFIGFQFEPMVFDMGGGPNADWLEWDADNRQFPVQLKPD
jgi:hypothetical protein